MKRAVTGSDTIGTIVASDYKASAIFYKHKIDFCCGGGKSIVEVCASKNLDTAEILKEINEFIQGSDTREDLTGLAPDELAKYIVEIHHKYVREHVPVIRDFLKKLCAQHGHYHPELFSISQQFEEGAEQLLLHMNKEEGVLFPMISNMMEMKRAGKSQDSILYSTYMPIRMMRQEHDVEGQRFARIAELSSQYTAPEDGCNTYRAAYALLQEFERDLHHHIHLENNILFPAVAALEETDH